MICKFCSGKFHGENMTCGMFGDVVVVWAVTRPGVMSSDQRRRFLAEEEEETNA